MTMKFPLFLSNYCTVVNVIPEFNDLFKQGILYFSIFLGFIVLHLFLNAVLTSKVPRDFCLRQMAKVAIENLAFSVTHSTGS